MISRFTNAGTSLLIAPLYTSFLEKYFRGTKSFLRSNQFFIYSSNSPHFMKPRNSLPYSQKSPNLVMSRTHPSQALPPVSLRQILRLFSHLRKGLVHFLQIQLSVCVRFILLLTHSTTCLSHHIILGLRARKIFRNENINNNNNNNNNILIFMPFTTKQSWTA